MTPGTGRGRSPVASDSPGAESIRVLHVDDERDVADLTAAHLERENDAISVAVETDPKAALARFDAGAVDCVVADYDMPTMDGLELLDRVREDNPDLPVILFTGKGSEEIASEAISRGITDYLQKGSGTEQYELLATRIENAVAAYRAERRLDEQESRFGKLIEHSPTVTLLVSAEGTIEYASPSAEPVLGRPPGAFVGENALERVHPDDRERVRTALDRLRGSDDRFRSAEYRYRHGDGDWRWLRSTGRDLTDDPDVGAFVVNSEDISDGKQRERELEAYRDKVEALHDVAIDLQDCSTEQEICDRTVEAAKSILDFDVCVVDIEEDGMLPIKAGAGFSIEEASTMSVEEGVAGRTYRTGESHLTGDVRDVDEAKPQTDYLSALSVAIGRHGVLQANARPAHAFDEDDLQLAELLATHTEQALNELERTEALREERDRFASLFEMVPEAVVRCIVPDDGDPVIAEVNPAFEETFGYDAETVIGESINEVIVPEDRLEEARTIDRQTTSEGQVDRQVRRLTANGPRDFLFRSAPSNDEATEGFGIYIDVTEQVERERELQRQNERLAQFTSVVSHDLRNPLTVARGRVEYAAAECDSEHLPEAEAALDRMGRLIDDLLQLASEGELVKEPEPVRLAPLVEDAWRTIEGDGTLEFALDDATVLADEDRLLQVFENLFQNAVDHAGTEPTVRVGTMGERGLYVADDGPGIPPDERDDVFDRAYTTREDGTGFGLSIVKEIVEAHGWELSVTEGRDGGARFEVTGVSFD